MMRKNLEIRNPWWKDHKYIPREESLPKRDLYFELLDNLEHSLILNIVGLRRVGKSTILKQLIAHLVEKKTNPEYVFYFLFDYASQIKKTKFLDEILSFYFEQVIDNPAMLFKESEKVYIFLDEIQYIENWQAVLKKYYDLSNKRIKFIVTGSQSMLLKGKNRESLAGRIFDYYLPPMSFREFIRIKQAQVEVLNPYDLFDLPKLFGKLTQFDLYNGKKIYDLSREYIVSGQFPETLELRDINKRHNYINESVIGKIEEDCVNIFNIEKVDEFKLMVRYLLNNVGSIFEIINIGREVKASKKTLEKYIGYLKESYIFEIIYKYHKSLIKRGRVSKKIYTTCTNFICALNYYTEDHMNEVPQAFGKIIENAVYDALSLKYINGDSISFFRDKEREIDFIISKNNKQLPMEVKSSNNIKFSDLIAINKYLKKERLDFGIVVTRNQIEKKNINGNTIYYIPYYLILMMI
ncbi:MAG: ATP-binding protein [Candidatus Pacebacteria bacterium]|nr:ATP-binding protein [Candidatus Paceibacterota bacterium]